MRNARLALESVEIGRAAIRLESGFDAELLHEIVSVCRGSRHDRSWAAGYVALEPVDMRFGYERLGGIVLERMQAEPRSRALFVFVGKRGHMMKVLTWDGTGAIVVHKKLDSVKRRSRSSSTGTSRFGLMAVRAPAG